MKIKQEEKGEDKTAPVYNITVIIVAATEEMKKIAAEIPEAIIVDKLKNHIRKTGTSGLAGEIAKTLSY